MVPDRVNLNRDQCQALLDPTGLGMRRISDIADSLYLAKIRVVHQFDCKNSSDFQEAAFDRIAPFDKRNDILHRPQPIGDASGHRWAHPKRLVDADKIVKHEIERQLVAVILDPLAESVRQSRKLLIQVVGSRHRLDCFAFRLRSLSANVL